MTRLVCLLAAAFACATLGVQALAQQPNRVAVVGRLAVTGGASDPIEEALRNGLRDLIEAGGLMSYSTDVMDGFHRAAYFIDRLLKGAKPSDLPFEQSETIKLVINLKTAKALGITIPQSILVRADEVIR